MSGERDRPTGGGGLSDWLSRVGVLAAVAGFAVHAFFLSKRTLGPLAPELGVETLFGLPPAPVRDALIVVGVVLWLHPVAIALVRDRFGGN